MTQPYQHSQATAPDQQANQSPSQQANQQAPTTTLADYARDLQDFPSMRIAVDMRHVRLLVRLQIAGLFLALLPRVLFGLPIHARASLRYESEIERTLADLVADGAERSASQAAADAARTQDHSNSHAEDFYP
jgi:hypothetical protein